MFISIFSRLPLNQNYIKALSTGYALMGVMTIIQLAMVPIYLENFGIEKFGMLVIILAINNYASIGITWLSGGMTRILSEYAAQNCAEEFRQAYAFTKWSYVFYIVIAITIIWLIAVIFFFDELQNYELLITLISASFYLILAYEYNADRIAFNARHWQAKGNLREIIGQVVFLFSVIFLLETDFGMSSVFLAQIMGIITTRFLAWFYWRGDEWSLGWMVLSRPQFKNLWQRASGKMGRNYFAYGVITLTMQADILILGWLTSPETVASYFLIWRIPSIIILIVWRIPAAYAPFLIDLEVKQEYKALHKNYKRGLYTITVIVGSSSILYATIGPYIVSAWVGEASISGHLPYILSAGAMFFLGLSLWPKGIAYSLLNLSPLNKIAAIEIVLKIVFILFLFDQLDYITPIVATIATHVGLIAYLYLKLGKSTIFSISRKSIL